MDKGIRSCLHTINTSQNSKIKNQKNHKRKTLSLCTDFSHKTENYEGNESLTEIALSKRSGHQFGGGGFQKRKGTKKLILEQFLVAVRSMSILLKYFPHLHVLKNSVHDFCWSAENSCSSQHCLGYKPLLVYIITFCCI